MVDRHNFSSSQSTAQGYFKEIHAGKLMRSRKCECHCRIMVHALNVARHTSIVAACVYAAARAENVPRTFKGLIDLLID